MILEPTLFVLGAGGSCPYEFPSGLDLRGDILRGIKQHDSPIRVLLRAAGFKDPLIDELRDRVRATSKSIDSFLQLPDVKHLDDLARTAIAAVMLPRETAACLWRNDALDHDWYAYLFNAMSVEDPNVPTNLKVISLNFDRSFEARLSLMLWGHGPSSGDRYDLERAVRRIPILHLHGDLGGTFPAADRWPQGGVDAASVAKETALRLRIVTDPIKDRVLRRAKEWISEAQRVCILGFGFHRFTLDRLGIPSGLIGKEVHITTAGLDPMFRERTNELFAACNPKSFNWETLTFLQRAEFLHK